MIAAVKTQAYAIQGDEPEVVRQIALAESIYSRVADLRSEPRWMWYFTEHKLHGGTSHALYLLAMVRGRPVSDLVSRLRSADQWTPRPPTGPARKRSTPPNWPQCSTVRVPGKKPITTPAPPPTFPPWSVPHD